MASIETANDLLAESIVYSLIDYKTGGIEDILKESPIYGLAGCLL